jgi:hypothetical protein
MKRLSYTCMVCGIVSVTWGGWDYVVSGGSQGTFILTGTQSLLMTGGNTPDITAKDSSYVEVKGSDPLDVFPGGITGIHLEDSSSLLYLGGETSALKIYEHAYATLEGGRIDSLFSFQDVMSPNQNYVPHIEIVCKEHEYDSLTKRLTGVWMDDTTFNIQLVNQSGYDPVIENIFFTPEPATLLLLGAGVMLIRKRR